jgi:hypothetical protein
MWYVGIALTLLQNSISELVQEQIAMGLHNKIGAMRTQKKNTLKIKDILGVAFLWVMTNELT